MGSRLHAYQRPIVHIEHGEAAPTGPNGAVKPVRMWKNESHWEWVFPVGTILGEVLFIQAPDDKKWFAFEVRARRREATRWATGVFRPYSSAGELAAAIKEKRPAWSNTAAVKPLVDHLEGRRA